MANLNESIDNLETALNDSSHITAIQISNIGSLVTKIKKIKAFSSSLPSNQELVELKKRLLALEIKSKRIFLDRNLEIYGYKDKVRCIEESLKLDQIKLKRAKIVDIDLAKLLSDCNEQNEKSIDTLMLILKYLQEEGYNSESEPEVKKESKVLFNRIVTELFNVIPEKITKQYAYLSLMRGLTKSENVADIKPTKWESILEKRQEIHGDDKSIITNLFNLDDMGRQQIIQEDVDNKLDEFVSDFQTLLKDAKANLAKKLPREIVNYFFNANNDLLKRFPKQYDTLCQLKVDANKLISEKENQMNEMIRSVDSDVNELISQNQKQKKMSERITLVDSEKIVQSVLAKPATKIQTIFRQYKTRKLEEKAKKQETINTSRSHAIKVIDEVQSMWWKAKKNGSWTEEMITMKHNLSELMQSATLATTVDELDNVKDEVNNIKKQLLASKNIEPSQMLADVSPISFPASEKPSWFQQRWQAFKQSSIVNILSRLVKLLKKAIWSSEPSLNTPLSPLTPTAAESLHKEEEDGIELTDLSAGSSLEEQQEEKPSPK